ncbi:restriction endonuclease subunit S [Bacteroidales bacterium OttesenSCG-928-B11]|nr:restriction endonuclease subunit S [Bacteroidales bacterium OttesenSCG-928-B11]
MDTKKLRQKILDLAIRGKLVPQDPNDEPASVLIEKIRAEKERLIKEKKIKRDKNESYIYRSDKSYYEKFADGTVKCIDGEIPFEIPESWEWARWRNIFEINPKNNIEDSLDVSFIPMAYIKDGYSNEAKFDIKQWKDVKSGFTHFQNNDLGIAKITPCFENRKSVIFVNLQNGHGAGTTELHVFRPFVFPLLSQYALYIAKSEDFISNGVANFSGAVGQQRVGKDIIGDYLIALPPLKEISKILSALSELFLIVDGIEKDKMQLSICIQNFKSKILDLAIQGKLVPQDPNDEPASVLLERIKAEHPESKKKAKNISDNSHYGNLPFRIPQNWSWCQLEDILDYEQPTEYIVQTTDYSDLYQMPVLTAGKSFIIGYTDETEGIFRNPPVIIFDDFTTESKYVDFEFKVKSSAMKILKANSNMNLRYVFYFMSITRLLGDSHKRYWISEYSKLQIPIPPFYEQERIVNAVKNLFQILDSIKSNISN